MIPAKRTRRDHGGESDEGGRACVTQSSWESCSRKVDPGGKGQPDEGHREGVQEAEQPAQSPTLLRLESKALTGFPGGTSGKEAACQRRRPKKHRFTPWLGKTPWRKKWHPAPVFLPGGSHGWRSLVGTEWDMTEAT